MGQFNLSRLLLLPSFLSGFLCVIAVICLLAGGAWSYITGAQLFYEPLFGAFGVTTVLIQAPDAFGFLRAGILQNPLTYSVLICMAAILIGMLVFALLQGIERVTRQTSVLWYEFRVHTPAAQRVIKELLTRLAIRSVSFVCWVIYAVLFVSVLFPFCVLLLQNGLDQLESSWVRGGVLCLLAFAFLTIGTHLHVVFVRLCFLRPRLFGGYTLERATIDGN